jgi:hypothetical protein
VRRKDIGAGKNPQVQLPERDKRRPRGPHCLKRVLRHILNTLTADGMATIILRNEKTMLAYTDWLLTNM